MSLSAASAATPEHLALLKPLLVFTLLVPLPFLGAALGGTLLSVLFATWGRRSGRAAWLRLAQDVLAAATLKGKAGPILCLAVAVALFCVELAYTPDLPGRGFWGAVLALLLAGLLLIEAYRRLSGGGAQHPLRLSLLALSGVALAAVALLLLISAATLLLRPERWPLLAGQPWLFFSWSAIARCGEFFSLSLALTGAGILLFGAREARRQEAGDFPGLARKTGAVVALLALLPIPFWLVFDLFNLPRAALSAAVFALGGAAVLLALAATLLLVGQLERPRRLRPATILSVVLLLYLLFVLGDHAARETILTAATRPPTPTQPAVPVPSPPAAADQAPAPTLDGAAVFQQRCTPCHRFDSRLVGPPLNEVVPKYRDDPAALQAFLRNPEPRNPGYPPMPNLRLSDEEIAALAAYLLQQVQR
jgi:cytochrome c